MSAPNNGADIRIKSGCSIVAVERGEDLLVEFGADFHFEPEGFGLYLRQRGSGAKVLRDLPARVGGWWFSSGWQRGPQSGQCRAPATSC